ncbi:hypothetical protein [Brucella sp. IR073]|uniref:hypothetical protein n=1 Tax=unclassified Brucella TaxID=2632610 RepID=UPI003B9812CC
MLRFLSRVLAVASLALAVICAVLDAARSVGAGKMVATPLHDIWSAASPQTLADAQALVTHYISPMAWDPALIWVLQQPAWLILAVLALLFHTLTYRREARFGYVVAD